MVYEIKNSSVSIKVNSTGAEMSSFCTSDGTELLWQGNPEFWAKQSPVLFPVVGALRENKALINGNWYEIPKHGLVRTAEFQLVAQDENSLEFEITESEETKPAYPFDFSLKVKFEIGENSYKTTYTILNKDKIEMPFCIGAHPGFNVPFEEGFKLEDYVLEFATEETISSPVIITDTSIYDYTKKKMQLNAVKSVPLNNEMFANDVIVFEDFKQNQVAIKNPKTGKSIQMNFEELPMLGIWKPYNDAPFLCLEPWVGSSTTTLEDDQFTSKRYVKILKPNETASYSFTVEYK